MEAKPIPHIQDQEELEKTCLNMETTCVIAFLDTVREGKFNTDLNSLHTVLDFDFYMVSYVCSSRIVISNGFGLMGDATQRC